MPLKKRDNSVGLLATGDFGTAVHANLPLLQVNDIDDTRVLSALFRDYTFLASAYLLEPCDINFINTGEFGFGRQKLPKSIAVPLNEISQKIQAYPFMEYALSYALYNWKLKKDNGSLDYENLDLIRCFTNHPSEYGFILVHIAMVIVFKAEAFYYIILYVGYAYW